MKKYFFDQGMSLISLFDWCDVTSNRIDKKRIGWEDCMWIVIGAPLLSLIQWFINAMLYHINRNNIVSIINEAPYWICPRACRNVICATPSSCTYTYSAVCCSVGCVALLPNRLSSSITTKHGVTRVTVPESGTCRQICCQTWCWTSWRILTPSLLLFHCHCRRVIAVATITVSKQVDCVSDCVPDCM